MQEVGRQRAERLGFHINSVIADVHTLPFPDNHFDLVTLQFASRHLKIAHMFGEINRVLKPGGYFYHCDMLRPSNRVVEKVYYAYLRLCLSGTGFLFRSSPAALNLIKYFINALEIFYSTEELSILLQEQGYCDVSAKAIFSGMLGCHRARKPISETDTKLNRFTQVSKPLSVGADSKFTMKIIVIMTFWYLIRRYWANSGPARNQKIKPSTPDPTQLIIQS